MAIEVCNTSIVISPYSKGDCPIIEDMYTAIDAHTQEPVPCGYFIDEGRLYLPRGTSISKLEDLFGEHAMYNKISDPSDMMSRQHSSFYDMKDKIQEDSIMFLTGTGEFTNTKDAHQKSFSLQTGGGKGNPYSTKIPTPDGYKRMGDLEIGNEIFDRFGNKTSILAIYELGERDIYKVTFNDGRYSLCTEDHLWSVKIDQDFNNWTVRPLFEIIKDYKSFNDNNQILYKYHIPQNGIVKYNEQEIPADPWSFGCNIDHNDTIPDCYIYNTINIRNKLLRGLSFSKLSNSHQQDHTKTCLQSTSQKLLKQIQYILWGLGIQSELNSLSDNEFPYELIFELSNGINKNDTLVITDIKLVKQEQARCIRVDNPESLYLTENFIVTHNTFCTSYAITQLNTKALIITHKDSIRKQWIKTFKNMFDYRKDELLEISGSAVMESIMNDELDPADIYLVNHQTLHSYLSRHNPYMLHEFFKKIRIGIKVYDEAHLEFNNILLMDAFSNTDKTWYVTATFGRSDRTQDKCFNRAFKSVTQFGSHTHSLNRKHVIYHPCKVFSRIEYHQLRKLKGYRGINANVFASYAFNTDKNDTMYKGIKKIVDMIKDKEGKKLIFVGLINAANSVTDKLKEDFPDCSIGTYHSQISKADKEDMIKKDIIVTTIKSCGVGTDIKGLRFLVNTEMFVSKILAQQLIGRLREIDPDTDTYMFDLADYSIPDCTWWHKSRIKKLSELAKDTVFLDLEE